MALYKALNGDLKSQVDSPIGALSTVWVKDEWKEIVGDLWWDVDGNQPPYRGRNGYFCYTDVLQALEVEQAEFICEMEVDGASIIRGTTQCWARMRAVSIKPWSTDHTALLLDWCEGRAHDYWAATFPTEAGLWEAKQLQNDGAGMLAIAEPLYKGLFEDYFTLFRNLESRRKSQYSESMEWAVYLAYLLSLVKSGAMTPKGGGGWARISERIREGSRADIHYFVVDHLTTIEEYEP